MHGIIESDIDTTRHLIDFGCDVNIKDEVCVGVLLDRISDQRCVFVISMCGQVIYPILNRIFGEFPGSTDPTVAPDVV